MDTQEYFAELLVGSRGAVGCTSFVLHSFRFHSLDTIVLLTGGVVVTVWLNWPYYWLYAHERIRHPWVANIYT